MVNPSHPETHAGLQLEPDCRSLGQTKLFFNNFSPYTTPVYPSSFDSGICRTGTVVRVCTEVYSGLAPALSAVCLTDAKKGHYTFISDSKYLPLLQKTHTSLSLTKFGWSTSDPTTSGQTPGQQFLSS